MTKNSIYPDNEVKSKKKGGKFFAIAVVILCFALTLILSDLLSSLITVGGFSYTTGGIKLSAYSIYAISIKETQTELTASEISNIVKSQNGAGYVWKQNEVFYILASAYENDSDALKVKENIIGTYPQTTIVKIELPEIEFSSSTTKEEKQALTNAINSFKTVYQKLYDISISLDTNVTKEMQAKLAVSEVKSFMTKIVADFTSVFNGKMVGDINLINTKISEVEKKIEDFVNSPDSTIPYSSQLKYLYLETIVLQKELAS